MSIFSTLLLKTSKKDEKVFLAIQERLYAINSTMSEIAALAYSEYNPEVSLEASINEGIYLLDSEKDSRTSAFKSLSSTYSGRTIPGKLQRIEAAEDTLNMLISSLAEEGGSNQ